MDNNWKEIMDLAEKYGFLIQAYGGTATLATHYNQKDVFGEEGHIKNLKMNNLCIKTQKYKCVDDCSKCFSKIP